ncbi:MAG: serine protease, partial [Bacteroidetes bacterium]|nr:serine protease [Bacteroidota bacterium]
MKTGIRFFSYPAFLWILFSLSVHAQISEKGTPLGSILSLNDDALPIENMPDFDVQALIIEDLQNEGKAEVPYRYAYRFDVTIAVRDVGKEEIIADGTRIWRLAIESAGAYSLHFVFSTYILPEGATLFLYNTDKTVTLGAFTSSNNKPSRVLATAEIPGDRVIIEYSEPSNPEFDGELFVGKVFHAYRNIFKDGSYGTSGSCNVDINCPEGNDWQAEKHAVCRISMGSGLCSGALINNTANDGTPYFLTARHCVGSSDFNDWVFYFNYESPSCNGPDGSVSQTIDGCALKAMADDLDFCLVEMSSAPLSSYQPYFAGWNNSPEAASSTACIHHPSGDVKKISKDNDPPTTGTYGSGEYGTSAHWHIHEWDMGTTEGGSSGSPLFDENHRIIGNLTGGTASCTSNYNDYYAKFNISWDHYTDASDQLKHWLDPQNSGVTALDAYDPYGVTLTCDSIYNFTGTPTFYTVIQGGYLSGNNG